jgi:MFS family permease
MIGSALSAGATRAGRLFVIFMAPALGGLVPLALTVAQPIIAAHFGGGDVGRVMARTLFSLPSLMIMIGAPLGGYLAQRHGYRRVLLTSVFLYSIAGSAGLLIDDFYLLLLTRLVAGFAAGTIMALYLALAAAYYHGTERARILGFAVAFSSAVNTGAIAVSGRLLEWGGWHAPFLLYSLGFLTLAIAWATVHIDLRQLSHTLPPSGEAGAFRTLAQLWPVYLTLTLLSVGTFMPTAGGPFLLSANGVEDPVAQSNIISAGSVPSIFTAMAYGFLSARFSDHRLLAMTGLLMGAGLLLAVPLHGNPGLLATFVLIGIGVGFKMPASASVLMANAPVPLRAAASGLSFTCIYMGQLIGPALLELLQRRVGIHGAFVTVGGMLLCVGAFAAIAGIGRREEIDRPNPGVPRIGNIQSIALGNDTKN